MLTRLRIFRDRGTSKVIRRDGVTVVAGEEEAMRVKGEPTAAYTPQRDHGACDRLLISAPEKANVTDRCHMHPACVLKRIIFRFHHLR